MSVTRSDIIRDLEAIGLKTGDSVMVHSSLSSIGHVEGGAQTVVEAFLELLGRGGTLMVPTFTHSGCQYFDPLVTPSLNGAITEAARQVSGAVRSFHPTHAATAIGLDAASLVDDLDRGALGRDCALDRLCKKGGYVLLLGVGQKSNSTIHVGEDYAGDDRHKSISRKNPKIVILNHPEMGEMKVTLTEMMGGTVAFDRMEEVLRRRNQLTDGKVGEAKCQLMKGEEIIAATLDILK